MDRDSDGVSVIRLEVVKTGRSRRWTPEEKIQIVEGPLDGAVAAGGFARALILPDGDGVSAPAASGRMEIVAHGGRRVIVGADVDASALARALQRGDDDRGALWRAGEAGRRGD